MPEADTPLARFLRSPLLSRHGVVHGFSTRRGGVSTGPYAALDLGGSAAIDPEGVQANHHRLAAAIGFPRDHLATVHQVHGDAVVLASLHDDRVVLRPTTGIGSDTQVSDPHAPGALQADAVVTTDGAVAGVRTADCVPVLLFHPPTGLAAAVHAGWRGTVSQVVVRTLEALHTLGVDRFDELVAAIGPCIGRCCFEVSPELAGRFEGDPAFGAACVEHRPGGRPHVDLVEANARLLVSAGVPERAIDRLARCTSCEPELFFSHRRDHGQTGRHLSVIASRR